MSTIIIGNSPNVKKAKMGEVIDSYDTVIRINNFQTCGYEKYVGTKTDLWYRTFDTKSTNYVTKYGFEFEFMWLVFPLIFYKEGKDIYKQLNKLYGSEKVNMVDESVIRKVHEDMEFGDGFPHPSTGMLTIGSVIEMVKEPITLYGFDFFETAKAGEPTPHYFKEENIRTDGEHKFFGCHIPEKERGYVEKYKKEGKVVML